MSDDKKPVDRDDLAGFLGTEEVPGHPGFLWYSEVGKADPAMELEFRTGYYEAIESLFFSIQQRGGSYARGYQHALAEIGGAMNRRGRLDAGDIEEWVRDTGRRWVNDLPYEKRVLPPPVRLKTER